MATSSTRRRPATKVAQVKAVREEAAVERVKDLTPKSASSATAAAAADVTRQFGEIQASLTQQLVVLEDVKLAIEAKRAELQQLHSLDQQALELGSLQDTITTTKSAWAREVAERQQQWQDEKRDNDRAREQEEADWEHGFSQRKRNKETELAEYLVSKRKQHDEAVAASHKSLSEREAAIKAAETELADMRKRTASFDDAVTAAVTAKVAAASAAMKRDFDHQKALTDQAAESRVSLAQARVSSLEERVKLAEAARDREAQLVEALRADIARISSEAFQSVAGKAALEAVKDMQRNEVPTSSGKR